MRGKKTPLITPKRQKKNKKSIKRQRLLRKQKHLPQYEGEKDPPHNPQKTQKQTQKTKKAVCDARLRKLKKQKK